MSSAAQAGATAGPTRRVGLQRSAFNGDRAEPVSAYGKAIFLTPSGRTVLAAASAHHVKVLFRAPR